MPTAMSASATIVLVTGINGYIASHIGLQLLQKGFVVRGTSRSQTAKQHLIQGAFDGYESHYQHVVVADMMSHGAFDGAVNGVHYIVHTASPVHFTGTTVDDYFEPAVGGVLSILKSTKVAGSQLRGFVLTSSISAIVDRWKNPPSHKYSEDDWNTSGEAVARETFTAPVAYGASKAKAERAMWDWKGKNQPTFSVSSIQPVVVMGPPVSFPSIPQQLGATLAPVWQIFSGEAKLIPPQIGTAGFIDVRDVAAMHVWCVENSSESNEQRYLIANGKAPPQAFADLLRKRYPDRDIVVGNPGEGYIDGYWYPPGEPSIIPTKALRAMGVTKLRGFEEMLIDTVEAFERQWPSLIKNQRGLSK